MNEKRGLHTNGDDSEEEAGGERGVEIVSSTTLTQRREHSVRRSFGAAV